MKPLRIRFTSVAVLGLGLFVAAAMGVSLYLSGAAALRGTQALLAERAELLVDTIEHRLDMLLRPVDAQAAWIAEAIAERRIDLDRRDRFDVFMSGALGSTPQVASILIVDASGTVRRWDRERGEAASEDWSSRANVAEWLARGRTQAAASWRPPLWAQARGAAVLMHDAPLHRDGRFIGMLAQVVPVAELSQDLAGYARESGATPFILYGGNRVLAHPRLAGAHPGAGERAEPLPEIGQLGDAVLERMRSPDIAQPIGMRALSRAKAVAAQIGDERYLYLYRDIERYGPESWTLGAHIGVSKGGFAAEMWRLAQSLIAGAVVLVLSVLAAAFAGRRLSRPVQAFARAAKAVQDGKLDEVPVLPRSAIAEFDDAGRSFNRMVEGLRERNVIRQTLGQFVPEEVARALLSGGGRLEPVEAEATVLFCDLEGFTALTETLGPGGVVEFLNAYFEKMVSIVERHGGVITQFQGDAILAVFNVPLADPAHAANALRAAIEMVDACDACEFAGVRARNRAGVATGRLVAGAVGARGRLTYTVHGDVVNMAARLEALNKDYGTRILVSGETAARCAGVELRKVADAQVRGLGEPVALFTPAERTRASAPS